MTMICGNCGQYGIRWMGPFSNLTHTECPHCGGQNCQREEAEQPEERDTSAFMESDWVIDPRGRLVEL
ncbi:hypothetical protein EC913_16016 [Pseudomonas sp. LP_4_YM]|uniref:hypothetical protein n=2 Tax=Pseudomonas TaxID=286 RepID=UPI0010D20219|nr:MULTISPECIES: hypothetical protein [Pseudomonas]MCE1033103.1 DNA repair protein RadA [Pseudomonas asiatica]TCT82911.1 hypothetical protein EC913_16016 [Pseudomonas sp. LP_4_YM]